MGNRHPTRTSVLPTAWHNRKLGDICTVDWGNTSITKEQYSTHGYPAFSAAGQDGALGFHEHDGEAVIISAIGAECGKCFFADGKWTAIKNTIVVKARDSKVSIDYLYRILANAILRIRTGSGQPFIGIGEAKKLCVVMPPIGEQKGIARVLRTIDTAIERTRAVIEQVRAVKQALLADLMTNGLPGRHKKIKTVKRVGRIPTDWSVTTIGACMDFITDYRGKTPPYVDDGIPVISAENVGDGRIRSTTKYVTPEVYSQWTTRGFPEPDDVVFTTEAPVAEVALLPGDRTYLLTRRVMALRPENARLRKRVLFWHLYLLKSCGAWETYCHGSTVPRILKPDILNRPIPLPSIREQDAVVHLLDGVEHRHLAEEKHLIQLGTAKSALSDALLTGKVRVPIGKEAIAG